MFTVPFHSKSSSSDTWLTGSCSLWTKSSVCIHVWVWFFFFLVIVYIVLELLLNWSGTLIFILVSAHTMYMSQMKRFSPSRVAFSVVNRKITTWHFLPVAHKWRLRLSFCPAHSFLQRYGQHLPAWLCDSNHSSLCIPSPLWSPTESSQAIILPVMFIHCIVFVFQSEAYFAIFMATVWPVLATLLT